MNAALTALQQRLGHRFSQPELLTRAVTHRSFGADHNERLEFLGDAVLSTAVSGLLYERFAGGDEGDLTRVRAHLVREDSLHRVALQFGIPEVLRLSEGEARGGGAQRPSILADAVEALEVQGVPIRRVLLIGGAARSAAVAQIAPQVLGRPVLVADPGEYVADGAARQAARTLGAGSDAAWPAVAGRWVEASSTDLDASAEARSRYAALRDASA